MCIYACVFCIHVSLHVCMYIHSHIPDLYHKGFLFLFFWLLACAGWGPNHLCLLKHPGDTHGVQHFRKQSRPYQGSTAQCGNLNSCRWSEREAELPHVLCSWSTKHCFWNIKHSFTSPSSFLARGMSMDSSAIPQIWYLTDSRPILMNQPQCDTGPAAWIASNSNFCGLRIWLIAFHCYCCWFKQTIKPDIWSHTSDAYKLWLLIGNALSMHFLCLCSCS